MIVWDCLLWVGMMSNKSLVSIAYAKYCDCQYQEALELYKQLATMYGAKLFEFNINMCLRKLGLNDEYFQQYTLSNPYPKSVRVDVKDVACVEKYPTDIVVAAILDEFSYNSFKYECDLFVVEPDNWRTQFDKKKPDLFFCESAWSGSDSVRRPWKGKIYASKNFKNENRTELLKILEYCKLNKIPTFFWNKEDPTHYPDRVHDFVKTAILFDIVFTSAEECVEKYKKDYGIERVYSLPFATQPKLFNPIEMATGRANEVIFAGSWYAQHPERCKEMIQILDAVLQSSYGLKFYDRQFNNQDSNHEIPQKYQQYVYPSVPHTEIASVYKSSIFGLNINTVTDSKTMFARRVFELMSSNTLVLSNYSVGVDEMFGENVIFLDRSPESLQNLTEEKIQEIRERNLDLVLSHHTYRDRFEYILQTIGVQFKSEKQSVTLVIMVENHEQAQRAIVMFRTYVKNDYKLMLLVSNKVPDIEIAPYYSKYNAEKIGVLSHSFIKKYTTSNKAYLETKYFALISSEFLQEGVRCVEKAFLHASYIQDDYISLSPTKNNKYQPVNGGTVKEVFAKSEYFFEAVCHYGDDINKNFYYIR